MNVIEFKEYLNLDAGGDIFDPKRQLSMTRADENTRYENGHEYTKICLVTEDYSDYDILLEMNFKDGQAHGLATSYGDGELGRAKKWEINLEDGELHGLCTCYDCDTGEKYFEENYQHGKLHGLAICWEDGKKIVVEDYKEGELLSSIDEDGEDDISYGSVISRAENYYSLLDYIKRRKEIFL